MNGTDRIRFECPHCENRLRVAVTAAGKRIRCPKCSKGVEVPLKSEAAKERMESNARRTIWPWFAGGGVALLLFVGLGTWVIAGIKDRARLRAEQAALETKQEDQRLKVEQVAAEKKKEESRIKAEQIIAAKKKEYERIKAEQSAAEKKKEDERIEAARLAAEKQKEDERNKARQLAAEKQKEEARLKAEEAEKEAKGKAAPKVWESTKIAKLTLLIGKEHESKKNLDLPRRDYVTAAKITLDATVDSFVKGDFDFPKLYEAKVNARGNSLEVVLHLFADQEPAWLKDEEKVQVDCWGFRTTGGPIGTGAPAMYDLKLAGKRQPDGSFKGTATGGLQLRASGEGWIMFENADFTLAPQSQPKK